MQRRVESNAKGGPPAGILMLDKLRRELDKSTLMSFLSSIAAMISVKAVVVADDAVARVAAWS